MNKRYQFATYELIGLKNSATCVELRNAAKLKLVLKALDRNENTLFSLAAKKYIESEKNPTEYAAH